MKISHLHLIIVLWSIAGFPLIAGVTSLLKVESSGISIIARGLVSVASLTLIFLNLPKRVNLALLFFLLFWSAYFFRLSYSLGFESEPLSRSPLDFWIWSIGVCALPGLAILLTTVSQSGDRIFLPLVITCGLASAIVYVTLNSSLSVVSDKWAYRLALDNLNPISVGHLGASTFFCGLVGFEAIRREKFSSFAYLGLLVVGLALMISANSRGPILAMVLALSIYFLIRFRRISSILIVVGSLILMLGVGYYMSDQIFSERGLLSRFTIISTGDDMSANLRVLAYSGALEQFLGSPFFGDGIEERNTQIYPHNLILEAFMTTGLLGGLPFLAFLSIGVYCAIRLMKGAGGAALIGLIAIQQTIAGQFSGAIYSSGGFWVSLCLAIALYHKSEHGLFSKKSKYHTLRLNEITTT